MNNPVKERIKRLRGMMQQQGIAAFIIPSTDPHISEYVAPHWQAREWFSGFTGSAGTLVVTRDEAGLWTDSRYFLQAAAQLEGSGICLYKEGLPDTPDIPAYLATHADRSLPVGYDAEVCADSYAERGICTITHYQQSANGNFGANKYGNFTITQKDGKISFQDLHHQHHLLQQHELLLP